MLSSLRLRKLTKSFWHFVTVESCAPTWVLDLPKKSTDRFIGFCESLPETEPFALAEESFFLRIDGQWQRFDYREVQDLEGHKADAFMETRLRIRVRNGTELNYLGRNAFCLWGALNVLINDLSKEISLHLSEKHSLALDRLAAAAGRTRSDLAKELLSNSIELSI